MVPDGDLGAVNEGWADLRFYGDKALYFSKVRQMGRASTLSPAEVQMMATKLFGQALVQRVKAALAARGLLSLPLYQWEEMVTSYIDEIESTPGFHSWPQAPLEPVFKGVRNLRQVWASEDPQLCAARMEAGEPEDSVPEVTPDVPNGVDEEEWDMRVSLMQAAMAIPTQKPAANRIGKGERPCFCCRAAGHSWIRCNQRKRGKCGVCGSKDHYTRFCSQRYYPDPRAIAQRGSAPNKGTANAPRPLNANKPQASQVSAPAKPSARNAVATKLEEAEIEVICEEVESPKIEANNVVCWEMLPNTPPDWAILRQAYIPEDCDLALLSWLKKRWQETTRREKIGKPMVPIEDPTKTGQLFYSASVDGRQGKMLFDPGASHCFMDWR